MCLDISKIKEMYLPGYILPQFNIEEMIKKTKKAPAWLHMGAGNMFRIFMGSILQELLDLGAYDRGVIVYEAYDDEIIEKVLTPNANLTIGASLYTEGSVEKQIIASIADAFCKDAKRLINIAAEPSLQLVSFAITEKGYTVKPQTVAKSPGEAVTSIELITAGLLMRMEHKTPLALVSLDNFSKNGSVLKKSIKTVAEVWLASGHAAGTFLEYLESLSYPWTMVDKITPRPSEVVKEILVDDGFLGIEITETSKNTYVAPFVNAESSQYLVMEDDFPNSRPPFEKVGVYMTDKETVHKMEQMKVCVCLNPLHTSLAISGMLLKKPTIAECMKDKSLVGFISKIASEAMPTVVNPGIIEPAKFLNEVITERFPNPYIPDTPARIACDSSQKIPIRFGVALKELKAKGLLDNLEAIPLFIALWLRYRTGLDDWGERIALSPDPGVPKSVAALEGLPLGSSAELTEILKDKNLFGVDLYEEKLAAKIETLFAKLMSEKGTVARKLAEF